MLNIHDAESVHSKQGARRCDEAVAIRSAVSKQPAQCLTGFTVVLCNAARSYNPVDSAHEVEISGRAGPWSKACTPDAS